MSTTELRVTLPADLAEEVMAVVTSGRYASESEAVRQGLEALLGEERAVERWLRDDVVPAYQALRADPSRGRTPGEVRATLALSDATKPDG